MADTVGDLFVRIRPDAKLFATELKGQMAVAGGAAGKASGDLQGLSKAAAAAQTSLGKTGKTAGLSTGTISKLGTGATLAGGALVAGFGLAIGATVRFDKAMSEVGAVSDATGKQLDSLRSAAIQAGKDTAFSATEAATAEGELAKAGISTSDILGGALTGSLNLAAAGSLGLGDAASIAAQAMTIFNLKGKDVGHIADVLAAGANKSTASVASLGEGLGNVGGLAAGAGASLEQTVGVLSLLDQNSIRGAEGGTALRSMLVALRAPSKEAADEMERYGIKVYDAAGNFIGFEKLAGTLKAQLKGLTQQERDHALSVIFGTYGQQAANVLYKEGAIGVREYTKAVNDDGAAAEVARKKTDNLAGDVERLGGSFETALIGAGSKGTGVLREMAQAADGAVSVFTELPAPIQSGALTLSAFGGAALLAAGAVVKFGPTVSAASSLVSTWATNIVSAGVAAGATTAEVGALAAANVRLTASMAATSGVGAAAGTAIAGIGSAISAATIAASLLNPALLVAGFDSALNPAKSYADQLDDIGKGERRTALDAATSAKGRAKGADLLSARLTELTGKYKEQKKVVDGFGDTDFWDNFTGKSQKAATAQTGLDLIKSKISGVKAAMKEYGVGAEAAGIKTAAMVDSVTGGASAFEKFLEPVNKAAERTQDYVDSVRSTYDAQYSLIEATGAVGDVFKDTKATVLDQQKAILAVSDAEAALAVQRAGPGASAAQKQKAGLDAQVLSLQGLGRQYPAMKPFVDEYIKKLLEASAASDSNAVTNQAAISVLDALKAKYPELTKPIDDVIQKVKDAQTATSGGAVTNAAAIGVLEALKAKYGDLIPEIQTVIDKINGIPPTKGTTITAETAAANAALDDFSRKLAAVKNEKVVTVRVAHGGGFVYAKGGVIGQPTAANIPHFASGGVSKASLATVGEHGTEVAAFPNGTRILSHADSMKAVRDGVTGGGGTVVNVGGIEQHFHGPVDRQVLAESNRSLVGELQAALRTGAG